MGARVQAKEVLVTMEPEPSQPKANRKHTNAQTRY